MILDVIRCGALAFVVFCAAMAAARGHDDADWIREQDLRSKTGQQCCGNGDCAAIDPAQVRQTEKGYLITGTNELIPYAEAAPLSIDGRLWVCRSVQGRRAETGGRRCVFDRPGLT